MATSSHFQQLHHTSDSAPSVYCPTTSWLNCCHSQTLPFPYNPAESWLWNIQNQPTQNLKSKGWLFQIWQNRICVLWSTDCISVCLVLPPWRTAVFSSTMDASMRNMISSPWRSRRDKWCSNIPQVAHLDACVTSFTLVLFIFSHVKLLGIEMETICPLQFYGFEPWTCVNCHNKISLGTIMSNLPSVFPQECCHHE